MLTSQPLGVVLDAAKNRLLVAEAAVDDSVTGQEVGGGRRVEVSVCSGRSHGHNGVLVTGSVGDRK